MNQTIFRFYISVFKSKDLTWLGDSYPCILDDIYDAIMEEEKKKAKNKGLPFHKAKIWDALFDDENFLIFEEGRDMPFWRGYTYAHWGFRWTFCLGVGWDFSCSDHTELRGRVIPTFVSSTPIAATSGEGYNSKLLAIYTFASATPILSPIVEERRINFGSIPLIEGISLKSLVFKKLQMTPIAITDLYHHVLIVLDNL